CTAAILSLFDHLVGLRKQRRRHGEADRLGGLEVDHEIERCWLHHWKFGGPFAFENSASIDSNLAIGISQAGAIADKSSRLGKFAAPMHRGNCVTRRKCCQLFALAEEERIGAN